MSAKPRPALSVGAVGHRPNRLLPAGREKVAAEILQVLTVLAREMRSAIERESDIPAPAPPLLSLVSALAEGADTMAAEAALAMGFMLDVVLPFPAESYEEDFATAASRKKFCNLLSRARSILTLPGSREDSPRAYEMSGLTILSRSDILLAIWDGGPSAGRGGTTDMLLAAARAGKPIIHVDARANNPACVLWRGPGNAAVPAETIEDLPSAGIHEAIPVLIHDLISGSNSASPPNLVADP